MERDVIEETVRNIITGELDYKEFTLEPDTRLGTIADSLDMWDICVMIEDEFDIIIWNEVESRTSAMTFTELCNIVEEKVSKI